MSDRFDLLIEIGSEEIPARFCAAARAALAEAVRRDLEAWGVAFGEIRSLGTPRRLAVLVHGVAAEQPARKRTILGPPEKHALAPDGSWSKAAEGFAKKNGHDTAALTWIDDPQRGRVAALVLDDPATPSAQLILAALPAWVAGIPFGKNMRWTGSEQRFARPIRWLAALAGDRMLVDAARAAQPHVDLSTAQHVAGVAIGRTTRGHRFLGRAAVDIPAACAYLEVLRAEGVIVDPVERRATIRSEGDRLAAAAGLTVEWDEALLDEVVDLLEWPQPMLGSFPERYLQLPDVVLTAPMKGHQRYFPLRRPDGSLDHRFMFVANRPDDPAGEIAAGNARVLAARLADAEFFWTQDIAKPLAAHAESLAAITWQEGLGSLADLAARVGKLAAVEHVLHWFDADAHDVERAASLYLADLGTHMVYEYGELAGQMGRIYALRDGESTAVATAIAEAYMPRGAEDALPQTGAGRALALAHRIDLIVGHLILGHEVKGNTDPYGLRRAAIGAFRILVDAGLNRELVALSTLHIQHYKAQKIPIPGTLPEALAEFWSSRLTAWLTDQGYGAAEVRATVAVVRGNPVAALGRLAAWANAFPDESARARFLDTYKRLRNIARDAKPYDDAELTNWPDPESAAFAAVLGEVRAQLDRFLYHLVHGGWNAQPTTPTEDAARALAALATLEDATEALFEGVRIQADDPALRERRVRLVRSARDTFDRFMAFDALIGGER